MDFFDAAYRGTPPWDIGRPQKEFVELVRRGEITGSVLDIGCGSGEHALFFAQEGYDVWGIDSTPLAIQKAREKAARQGLLCRMIIPKFVVWYLEPINPQSLTMSLVKHVGFSGDNYLYPPTTSSSLQMP